MAEEVNRLLDSAWASLSCGRDYSSRAPMQCGVRGTWSERLPGADREQLGTFPSFGWRKVHLIFVEMGCEDDCIDALGTQDARSMPHAIYLVDPTY